MLLGVGCESAASTRTAAMAPFDVALSATADPLDVYVGSPIAINLAAEHPDNVRVYFERLPSMIGSLGVESQTLSSEKRAGERTTMNRVVLVPYESGQFEIVPPKLFCWDEEASMSIEFVGPRQPAIVGLEPFRLRIRSTLRPNETDFRPIVSRRPWSNATRAILLAATLAMITGFGRMGLQRWRQGERPASLDEQLSGLRQASQRGDLTDEELLHRSVGLLRATLAAAWDVPVIGWTASQIATDYRLSRFPDVLAAAVCETLRSQRAVRYEGEAATSQTSRQAVDTVAAVLAETAERRTQGGQP